ncbi:hypothetical protein D3C75_1064950 [compost metagenome]
MELDSQQALTHMASMGLGVAIVPLADEDLQHLPAVPCCPLANPSAYAMSACSNMPAAVGAT